MVSRAGLIVLLSLLAVSGSAGSARATPSIETAMYTVRVDPRLCPSPLCGGYWVALANAARTPCADGHRRTRCYVARAVDADRNQLEVAIPDGALVRARLDSAEFGGVGRLGVLAVATSFAPAGAATLTGGYYRLVDTGIRCVRAPCFSIRASVLNRSSQTTTSGLVLTTLGQDPDLEKRVLAALETKNGVLARGRIVRTPQDGREFHASRFYLRSQS